MLADRRVKIVATVGPASSTKEALRELFWAGVNVFRLNFSHGTHEDHLKVLKTIREISSELQAPIAILQDLQGPKIRVGKMEGGKLDLKEGQRVKISTQFKVGKGDEIPTDFAPLASSVSRGSKILLDDGLIELSVEEVQGEIVTAAVVFGGELKDRKGMNLPGATLPIEGMTEKDLKDLEFGLVNNVDYIALSFVRQPSDIRRLRELIQQKNHNVRIVAKIEMLEAIQNLEDIIHLSDGVMVARGDLAVEVGQSHLAGLQKEIIKLSNRLGKPVITATQMLDSMVDNPRPTRAEVTDIANAVLDGSDALMLSAETASGKYPTKCVEVMDEVVREVEKNGRYYYSISLEDEFSSVAESIAASACLSAKKLHASAIVCLTTSGKTARLISAFRPKARIIAVTHLAQTLNRLELVWGIQTLKIDPYDSSDQAMEQIEKLLIELGIAKTGDKVILTMGLPVLERGTTNSLRVYRIHGESLKKREDRLLPLRYRSIKPKV